MTFLVESGVSQSGCTYSEVGYSLGNYDFNIKVSVIKLYREQLQYSKANKGESRFNESTNRSYEKPQARDDKDATAIVFTQMETRHQDQMDNSQKKCEKPTSYHQNGVESDDTNEVSDVDHHPMKRHTNIGAEGPSSSTCMDSIPVQAAVYCANSETNPMQDNSQWIWSNMACVHPLQKDVRACRR